MNMSENGYNRQEPYSAAGSAMFWGMPERTYCMLLHLSVFAGVIIPGAGFILPIVMWAVNKDKSPVIDRHGRNLLNFLISMSIYTAAAGLLCFLLVGIPVLMVLGIAGIILPIMCAVNANNGIYRPYPFCIRFFSGTR